MAQEQHEKDDSDYSDDEYYKLNCERIVDLWLKQQIQQEHQINDLDEKDDLKKYSEDFVGAWKKPKGIKKRLKKSLRGNMYIDGGKVKEYLNDLKGSYWSRDEKGITRVFVEACVYITSFDQPTEYEDWLLCGVALVLILGVGDGTDATSKEVNVGNLLDVMVSWVVYGMLARGYGSFVTVKESERGLVLIWVLNQLIKRYLEDTFGKLKVSSRFIKKKYLSRVDTVNVSKGYLRLQVCYFFFL